MSGRDQLTPPDAPRSADPRLRPPRRNAVWLIVTGVALLALFVVMWRVAEVDLARLWAGLPRLFAWSARAWPPDFTDTQTLLLRAAETLSMATLGTLLGALIAAPLCLLGARNVASGGLFYAPVRALLNVLRGIDSFVFALLFVAAVGLGPFAGLLGIGVHTAGSMAKLWSEAIETAAPGPLEAATLTGASRLKIVLHALLPDVTPQIVSSALYLWEFNVRASTVLGVVGAGGLGQELKNAVDLLDFPRVFAIILVILVMVTAIDAASAYLRRRLS